MKTERTERDTHFRIPAGFIRLAALVLVLAGPLGTARGRGEPATLRVAAGLSRPVFATTPPEESDRLFVLEQSGRILIFVNGSALFPPFLDLTARVSDIGPGHRERGLLGLAFDPDYIHNGYFYVNYTAAPGVAGTSHATIVARYAVSGNSNIADPASGVVLLEIAQPFGNHNGGMLAFGPFDGLLYIGTGDGGSSNDPGDRAQDPESLLGKLLRLDVRNPPDYVPASNPFVGVVGVRQRIWAVGLRNPWRFSFDRETGDLYIGDVGQNAREEIDFQPASSVGGENYGWRCMEGNECTGLDGCPCALPGQVDPIHEYGRGDGCSVTGGYVYRGSAMPDMRGTYFFADWCSGRIWSFRYNGTARTEFTDRTDELRPSDGPETSQVSSFGQDSLGELYVVYYGSMSAPTGEVLKIVPAGDFPDADGEGTPGFPVSFNQDEAADCGSCGAVGTLIFPIAVFGYACLLLARRRAR